MSNRRKHRCAVITNFEIDHGVTTVDIALDWRVVVNKLDLVFVKFVCTRLEIVHELLVCGFRIVLAIVAYKTNTSINNIDSKLYTEALLHFKKLNYRWAFLL